MVRDSGKSPRHPSKGQSDLRPLIERTLAIQRRPLSVAEVAEAIQKDFNKPLGPAKTKEIKTILVYGARRPHGKLVRIGDRFEPRSRVEARLRRRVRKELAAYHFKLQRGSIIKPALDTKSEVRDFHSPARHEKYEANRKFVEENEVALVENFADGQDIDIKELWPKLEVVESGTDASDLFRFATLLWSVPVSEGFGRRVRFLLRDEHTDKVLGLFALGDPVFNLSCRDDWIGWNHFDREKRLYNVMDIFVLGAVPPYNMLLGGKLTAMIAASNEVRRVIQRRYAATKTVIQKKRKDPRLALLTTGSALGKSAIYDRIRYRDMLLYQKIGESKGWGHFHLNNGLFEEMRAYLDATVRGKSGNRFGAGPNWKMRTVRAALDQLDLPEGLLQHGIRREIYAVPLAQNYELFLRGETTRLKPFDLPFAGLAAFWRERWLEGRATRKPEFKDFKRTEILERIRGVGGSRKGV